MNEIVTLSDGRRAALCGNFVFPEREANETEIRNSRGELVIGVRWDGTTVSGLKEKPPPDDK